QLGDEELGKLLIRMLKMNRRKLLVVEVIASGRPIAEGLKNPRDRRNSRQRLLRGERAKLDVIIDERGLRVAEPLFVRLHIRYPLAITVPQDVEQLRAEFFAG